jgi:hypothetical protein
MSHDATNEGNALGSSNSSSDAAAVTTQSTTQSMSMDEDVQKRKEKRREANRRSARKSRYRETVMIDELHRRNQELNDMNAALRRENQSLKCTISQMRMRSSQTIVSSFSNVPYAIVSF